MAKSISLDTKIQVWGFEDDFIIFRDGSTGFGLELRGPDPLCASDETLEAASQKYKELLNSLPSGIAIQFVFDSQNESEAILDNHAGLYLESENLLGAVLLNKRLDSWKTMINEGKIPKFRLRMFLRRPFTQDLLDRPKFFKFKKANEFPELSEARLRFEISSLTQLRETIEASLKTAGIENERLSAHDIAELMYLEWNPDRPVQLNSFDPEQIGDSILFSEVEKTNKGFTLGGIPHRVLSLKILPENTYSGIIQGLMQLPLGSRLCVSIQVPDQIKETETLQLQRRMAYAMVVGKKGVSDLESQSKLTDIETLLSQMIASGEKVFLVGFNIIVSDLSELVVERKVSDVLMHFRNLPGAEGMLETYAAFDIFAETAIPNTRSSERMKRMKSSNLADLLPLYLPWQGFSQPSVLLRHRQGSMFSFDPFDSSLTNANQIISGGSGSGKSYLTNLILNQMRKENPKIFVIDIGASYQRSCEVLDGQYIPLGTDTPLAINPFDLMEDEIAPSNQKIKFLVSLIEMMSHEEGKHRLSRLERAEIETAIQETYKNATTAKIKPRLSHLRECLLKNENNEVQKIGKILSPWTGQNPFGQFVDQETKVDFTKNYVCFDLKGLESHPDLQSVCLFLITDLVWREIQRDRTTKKFLVFDESWRLLESDAGSTFIAEVFRTFRKYYASAIAISQNIDDFAQSKAANAILPNSSIKWILRQKGANKERLQTVLSLNPHEVDLVDSLRQERGKFSEALLLCEDRHVVVAVESAPFEYWLATTDPKDLALIQKEQARTDKDLTQILELLSKTHPFGAGQGAQ